MEAELVGTTGALEMAEMAYAERISWTLALEWHLQNNHFPPVPPPGAPITLAELVWICKIAITCANDGDWDALLQLPGGNMAVDDVVDALHLHGFLREEL